MSKNDPDISTLQDYCKSQFEFICDKLIQMNARYDSLESKMEHLIDKVNSGGGGGGGGSGGSNFSHIEDKVDHLNMYKKNVIQTLGICHFIAEQATIKDSYIVDILKGQKTIYEISVDLISILYVDSKEQNSNWFLFAFPFQKHVLYYWNVDKMSWDKIDRVILLSIFETIQKKMICTYSQMVTSNTLQGVDIIDNGEKLFVDNFDKKYNEFKKSLFLAIIKC